MDLLAERRISPRAFIGQHVGAGAIGLVLAVVLFLTPVPFLAPIGILPLLGSLAYAYLVRLSSSYRLFPERLEVESGLVTRRIENVELFRVRDVGLHQGIIGRIANVGDVYVHSTDSSTPDLHVRGIDAPKEFYQQLREVVSESRAQHRTMIVEGAQHFPEG
jgi:hypothetical protein